MCRPRASSHNWRQGASLLASRAECARVAGGFGSPSTRPRLPPVVPMTAHLRGRLGVVDRWAERPVTRFERKATAAAAASPTCAVPTDRPGAADRVGQPPPGMLTSYEVPNRSTHIPNLSPHGWVASSTVTVPPSDSACQ